MKNHIDPDSLGDPDLRVLLVECLEQLERGESLDHETLISEYPQYAQLLVEFLNNQEMLKEIDSVRYIGEYEVLAEIARGGMGIVFQARQQSLNRIVALKMILAGRLADPREVERFQREARAAGRLNHPGIVPIF